MQADAAVARKFLAVGATALPVGIALRPRSVRACWDEVFEVVGLAVLVASCRVFQRARPITAAEVEGSLLRRRLLMPLGIVWMAGAGCAGASKPPLAEGNLSVADAALDATQGRNETFGGGRGGRSSSLRRRSRRRGSERKRRRLPRDRSTGHRREPLSTRISRAYFRFGGSKRRRRGHRRKWNRGGTLAGEAPPTPSGKVPHPAPRIKVDVLKISGRINEADVLRQARSKGCWPFQSPVTRKVSGNRGRFHGRMKLVLQMTSVPADSAKTPQKVAAEVDDPPVIGCVE